tara:strand:- start:15 stop:380 length:366 start_codon:yes stop_codon:yes gene_type:complete
MDTLKHYEDIVQYHNPNLDADDIFWLAHDLSMYHDAVIGCNMMIEKATGKRPQSVVRQLEQRKKMHRAKLRELQTKVGILNVDGHGYTDAEIKRMNDISEKEFRKANAHLYKNLTNQRIVL